MHELTVTQSILEIALRHAAQSNAEKITDLTLTIGQLASIIDESVQFYWDVIAQDTIAQGAGLHFNRVLAEFLCLQCDLHFGLQPDFIGCPECKGNRIKVLAGEEFFLESIQIETGQHGEI